MLPKQAISMRNQNHEDFNAALGRNLKLGLRDVRRIVFVFNERFKLVSKGVEMLDNGDFRVFVKQSELVRKEVGVDFHYVLNLLE